MSRRLCRTAVAGVLALCWGTAWSQDPPRPAPPGPPPVVERKIEVVQSGPNSEGKTQRVTEVSTPMDDVGEAIDVSQESSPEVAIAEAQLHEAEARLRQARMEAAQRAVQAMHIRKLVDIARKNVEEVEASTQAGVATHRDLLEAQQRLAEAEANLAAQEAELKVLGSSPLGGFGVGVKTVEAQIPIPRPELNYDDVKTETEKALDAPLSVEFDNETLANISAFISDYLGVNIVIDIGLQATEKKVSIRFQDIAFRDGLLALADAYGDLCFIVRDYGIFATTPERAVTINAPSIPSGIPLYVSASSQLGRRGVGLFKAFGAGAGVVDRMPQDSGGRVLDSILGEPSAPALAPPPPPQALPPNSGEVQPVPPSPRGEPLKAPESTPSPAPTPGTR